MCLTWLKLPLKVLWFAHDIVMQSLCYTDVWEAAPVFYVSCLGVQPHGMKNSCMEILAASATVLLVTSMSSAVSLVETTRMDRRTVSIRYSGTFRQLAHWGTRGVLLFVLSGQLSLSLSSVHWCHRRLDLPWLMSCLSVV